MRFLTSGFFHESTPYNPQIHTQNIFEFCFEFAEIFVFQCCSSGFDTPQDVVLRGIRPCKPQTRTRRGGGWDRVLWTEREGDELHTRE
jgi:hypothetical protein